MRLFRQVQAFQDFPESRITANGIHEKIKFCFNAQPVPLVEGLDANTTNRLRACIRLILSKIPAVGGDELLMGGSLEQELLRYEGELIRQALNQAQGGVTRAAKLLGVTHQGLCYMISSRHKNLLSARAPVRPRRKSIIKKW